MKKFLFAVVILIIAASAVYALGGGEAAPEDFVKKGIASFNAGNFDQAIADFNKAVEQKKNLNNAYLGLAYAQAKKDQWEDVSMNIYMAITSTPFIEKAFNDKVDIEYADEFLKIVSDFEKQLKVDLSGIKEDFEMSMHFAMQDVSRGLMMNADY